MKVNLVVRKKKPTLLLIALLVLLIFLPAAYYLTKNPFTARAAWFNDQWGYRKEIPVTAHTGAETNVYLNLTGAAAIDTSDTTKFQTDCGDLRFTNVRGEELKYYLVSGCGTATTVVHVLIPDFPAGAQTFYYYYGNPTVGNGTEPADFTTAASGVTIGSFGSEEKSPGPIAYWKLDEGTGSTANDAAKNNHGSLSGPTWQAEDQCISGKCLFFDGTNDVVTVSNTVAGLQTVSFWVRPITNTEQLIDINGTAYIEVSSGTISATGFTSPTIYVDGKVSSTLAANRWQHVAVTTGTPLSGSAIKFAQISTNYGQVFLDDVKLYNYARTADQIKTDYNAGKAHAASSKGTSQSLSSADNSDALSSGLVGYWKMDESSGNAADSSGNGYTLTNNAVATYTTGKFGNAASLSSASSQYFNTATNLGRIQTISFWIRPTTTTTYLLDLDGSRTITASSGTLSANNFAGSTIYVNGAVSSTITANTWQLVTVTTSNFITASALALGKVGSNYFDGRIDEFRLYNRALQPSEVAFLYNFAPGPIGYWKLDENTGSTANDSSSRGNGGTLAGQTFWKPGKYGPSLSFDGSGDYVNVGNISLYNFTSTQPRTLMAWFRTSAGSDQAIVAKMDSATSFRGYDVSLDSGGQFELHLINTFPTNTIKMQQTGATYNDGKWHHVAVTYDGSEAPAGFSLYIDGTKATLSTETNTYTPGSDTTTSAPFGIGSRLSSAGGNGSNFNGQIDDVKIYNYTRTQKQIIEDMNAGHPAPGSPVGSPVGYWKFDEGYGTSTNNSGNAGSALNGTLTSIASPPTATSGWTTAGRIKRAIKFDGTNDTVNLGNSTALDLSTWTVTTWIKASPTGQGSAGYQNIFYKGNGSTIEPISVFLYNGQPSCEFFNNPVDIFARYAADIRDNAWHHIACVRDPGNLISVYVDGILRNSAADAGNTVTVSNDAFIGSRISDNYFAGSIDETKIYNFALTADQVKLDYNQGSSQVLGSLSTSSDGATASNSAERSYCVPGTTTSCTPPILEWNMERTSGQTIYDTSGNNNFGNGNATTETIGYIGKARSFSPSGNNRIVSNANLGITGTESHTTCAWAKSTNDSNRKSIFTIGTESGGPTTNGYGFTIINTDLEVHLPNVGTIMTASISPTKWNYFCSVYDGTIHYVYINGALRTQTTRAYDFIDAPLNLGRWFVRTDGTYDFNGVIDQVKTYDYARTPAQIAWDYNRGAPFAWWKLDECQGTTIKDSSGNGYTGTWSGTGGATITAVGTCTTSGTAWGLGATGKFNSGMRFADTDDKVTVTDNDVFDFAGRDFTISAWANIKASDFTNSQGIIGKGTSLLSTYQYALFYDNNGANPKTTITFRANSGALNFSTGMVGAIGQWQNIVVTRIGSNFTIYVNGVSAATATYSSAFTADATDLLLGDTPGLSNPDNLILDDVRVYNYGLSQVQVKDLYNQGSTVRYGPTSGPP